ncbi:phage portal protein [Aeromicrobium fastidiosum]|uniref:phage portal protein n=1 Tax=Aeromicrobium fastidiosum TaxID=52699 RepID=UPI00165F117C|nr:phage portal protein [Aeromicrobium fastidiosum]MBP2390108.1 hypothetical protein [Aeromicrobium fastidiosum]
MSVPSQSQRRAIEVTDVTASIASIAVYNAASIPIGSPWADSNLQRVMFEDMFGAGVQQPVTRTVAMSVPPHARGRNRLVSTIQDFPLVELDEATESGVQPLWAQSTSGTTSPQHRMCWTVDDLIHYGASLWIRFNDPISGYPLAMDRVNRERWALDAKGLILLDGHPVNANDVVYIPGFHEGVLQFGADAIRDMKQLYRIVRQRIKNPAPNVVLKQTGGTPLTETEIDALILRNAKAREGENGGVGYASEHIDYQEKGASADSQLMVEGRNAGAVDIARNIGVSASLVDATAPKASLNYETSEGKNLEFVDEDLRLYMGPITARLSMDDVTPSGRRIAFDLTDYTAKAPSPTGPATED